MENKQLRVTSVADLINKKNEIETRKKEVHEVETSIGIIKVQKPSRDIVVEASNLDNDVANLYLVLNSVIEPNLKDNELQKAYDCIEPTDIVAKVFEVGEIVSLATYIMNMMKYNKDINRVLHEELKK